MKPYYSSAGIDIYLASWQEVLPNLERVPNTLCLGDPPYGIDYDPNGGAPNAPRQVFERIVGDKEAYDPRPLLALGYDKYVMWGANHYASRLPDSPGWLTWEKIGEGKGRTFSDCELAWTNQNMPARRFAHLWRGMIRSSEKDGPRFHPSQKPVALATWCIEIVGGASALVEPFMGSGFGVVAAKRARIPAVACEIVEAYAEKTAQRLEKETLSIMSLAHISDVMQEGLVFS